MKDIMSFQFKRKIGLIVFLIVFFGLSLVTKTLYATDPCTQCKNKCQTQYCTNKAKCNDIPAGTAREACYYTCENVRQQCLVMCNADGFCNDGDIPDPPPCFVSGRTDTCIRTP
jgi:hypothetical protein